MDSNGQTVYTVQGKMFSLNNSIELLNPNGSQVFNAKRKILSLLPKYFVYDPHNELVAEVKKLFAIRPKFDITLGHKELRCEGSFMAYSFGVFDGDNEIASVEKKILTFGDTYEIDIHDESNKELLLFLVIILDQILHEKRDRVN